MKTSNLMINTKKVDYDEFTDSPECLFCSPPPLELLTETENFYVTFDGSALIEGHVDIHSKEHIGCTGEIDPAMYDEFTHLKQWVGSLVKKHYGAVSFYEHGRAGHCGLTMDGVECHHFHLHALPLSVDVTSTISKQFDAIAISSESEIPLLYEQFDQYLYFENYKGEKSFFPVNKPLPAHYLRTVIAEALGDPELANWESGFKKEPINNFKQRLIENV